MIRKLTALLLTLALALGCASALAETAQVLTYTHPHIGYSFNYPDTFTALDAETIDAITNAMVNEGVEGIDVDYAAMKEQIAAMDIVNVLDMSNGDNITVLGMELGVGIPLDATMLATMVLPATVSSYEQQLVGCQTLDSGSVVTYGDNEYARLAFTYTPSIGTLFMDLFFFDVDDTLYTVTFTFSNEPSEELLEMVLGSFTFGA